MKFPRIRIFRRRALFALVIAPPMLWTMLILVAPTEWARDRLAKRLARASGSQVRLSGVSLGFFGGLTLSDLRFGGKDPWLRVDLAHVDVGLLRMLVGNGELTEFKVDGFDLRVHRRMDGTLECGDPLAPGLEDVSTDSDSSGEPRCGLQVFVRGGRVRVNDEPTGTQLEVNRVAGHATWESGVAHLEELRGDLNGGTIALAASLDRSSPITRASGQLRLVDVSLNRQTDALSMLIPIRSNRSDGVAGQADLSLYLQSQGSTPAQLRQGLKGSGVVELNPIRLDGTGMWSEMSEVLGLQAKSKVGSARSDFKIAGGRVSTENLTLDVGGASVVLTGWTDFRGGLDYRVHPNALSRKLPREARELLGEVEADLDGLLTMRVTGTLDNPQIDGGPTGGPDDPKVKDAEAKLKRIGRRLKQKYLR